MNTSIIITVIVNTSTVKVKSNCNKVAVKYSPTYESSMLYCTSNNIYETLHLVYTVVQGSKVSCAQLNKTPTVRVQLSLKPSSHNMKTYPYSCSTIKVLVHSSPNPYILKT